MLDVVVDVEEECRRNPWDEADRCGVLRRVHHRVPATAIVMSPLCICRGLVSSSLCTVGLVIAATAQWQQPVPTDPCAYGHMRARARVRTHTHTHMHMHVPA